MGFLRALGFLTVLPVFERRLPEPGEMASSMAFFPLVGLWLGAMLWLLDLLLGRVFPAGVVSALLIAFLALMTGGLHLDGFADTLDGIFGGRGDKARALEIMKDSRIGAVGVVGLILLLLVKYAALTGVASPLRTQALLLMPALSRWSQVLLCIGMDYARKDGGTARPFVELLAWRHFAAATAFAAGAVVLFSGVPGFAAFAAAALLAAGARMYFARTLGGVTGDTIGAVSELNEVVILLIFSAAPGLSTIRI